MQKSGHSADLEELYRTYSQDINALVSPWCLFDPEPEGCSSKDFVPTIYEYGMCYTFNSGTDERVKKVHASGVSNGLRVILDAQTHDYFLGRFSQGFTVLVHGQGQYVDEWEGTNVGPGQHAFIALSQKRVCFFCLFAVSFFAFFFFGMSLCIELSKN